MAKFNYARRGEPLVVEWPVKVLTPTDGGKVLAEEFTAKFKIAPADRLTELAQEKPMTAHIDFLKEVFVGLGKDETETFDDALRDWMISQPYIMGALNRAYANCSNGNAAVGNSEGPPA